MGTSSGCSFQWNINTLWFAALTLAPWEKLSHLRSRHCCRPPWINWIKCSHSDCRALDNDHLRIPHSFSLSVLGSSLGSELSAITELGLNFLTLCWFSWTFQMHSEFHYGWLISWWFLRNLTRQQSHPATSFLGPKVLNCVLLHPEKSVKESKPHSTTRTCVHRLSFVLP